MIEVTLLIVHNLMWVTSDVSAQVVMTPHYKGFVPNGQLLEILDCQAKLSVWWLILVMPRTWQDKAVAKDEILGHFFHPVDLPGISIFHLRFNAYQIKNTLIWIYLFLFLILTLHWGEKGFRISYFISRNKRSAEENSELCMIAIFWLIIESSQNICKAFKSQICFEDRVLDIMGIELVFLAKWPKSHAWKNCMHQMIESYCLHAGTCKYTIFMLPSDCC